MTTEKRERNKRTGMADRRALATRVDSGDLAREEQETWITFRADEDRCQIGSYVPSIVRQLLRHDEAEIEWVFSGAPEERGRRDTNLSELVRSRGHRRIEGVQAKLPLGALSVKGRPRKNDNPSSIVTTPEDLEGLEEVFGGKDDGD